MPDRDSYFELNSDSYFELKPAHIRRAQKLIPWCEMGLERKRMLLALMLMGRSVTAKEIAAFVDLWQCRYPEELVDELWAVLDKWFAGSREAEEREQ